MPCWGGHTGCDGASGVGTFGGGVAGPAASVCLAQPGGVYGLNFLRNFLLRIVKRLEPSSLTVYWSKPFTLTTWPLLSQRSLLLPDLYEDKVSDDKRS